MNCYESTKHGGKKMAKEIGENIARPRFIPASSTSTEPIDVQTNEIHLIPIVHLSRRICISVWTDYESRMRMKDDIVIITSRAGVIFARIPNLLTDAELDKWLSQLNGYLLTGPAAS
jgi:hypothetical protein